MEYTCIDKSWQEAEASQNLPEAIKLIEYQIATNLINVHNLMSDLHYSYPSDAYRLFTYAEVRKENKEKILPYLSLAETFYEINCEKDEEIGAPCDMVLSHYKELEEKLKKEMQNL